MSHVGCLCEVESVYVQDGVAVAPAECQQRPLHQLAGVGSVSAGATELSVPGNATLREERSFSLTSQLSNTSEFFYSIAQEFILLLLLYSGLNAVLNQYKFVPKHRNTRPFCMDNRERRSYTRGVSSF